MMCHELLEGNDDKNKSYLEHKNRCLHALTLQLSLYFIGKYFSHAKLVDEAARWQYICMAYIAWAALPLLFLQVVLVTGLCTKGKRIVSGSGLDFSLSLYQPVCFYALFLLFLVGELASLMQHLTYAADSIDVYCNGAVAGALNSDGYTRDQYFNAIGQVVLGCVLSVICQLGVLGVSSISSWCLFKEMTHDDMSDAEARVAQSATVFQTKAVKPNNVPAEIRQMFDVAGPPP